MEEMVDAAGTLMTVVVRDFDAGCGEVDVVGGSFSSWLITFSSFPLLNFSNDIVLGSPFSVTCFCSPAMGSSAELVRFSMATQHPPFSIY